MNNKILNAKIVLYKLLLDVDTDTITDNELDILLLLSKDEQIQQLLDKYKEY